MTSSSRARERRVSVLLSSDEQRMVIALAKEDSLSKSDAIRMAIRRAYGALAEQPEKLLKPTVELRFDSGPTANPLNPAHRYDHLYLPASVKMPAFGKGTMGPHGRPLRCDAMSHKQTRCWHLAGHDGWHEDQLHAEGVVKNGKTIHVGGCTWK